MIVPGIYRHYKGGLYVVIGVARYHDSGAQYVVYHPIAPHDDSDDSVRLNVRPLTATEDDPDGFLSPAVDTQNGVGVFVPRFVLLTPLQLRSI